MPRFHTLSACVTAAFLVIAPTANADAPNLLDFSIEQLGELRVTTVSRMEEPLADAPASVFVITGDEIRRSGVTSIAEALRLAPGVEVARRDAHSWSITIRGFNSDLANKLLVLIDGRSVYSPLYAGVFWDAQDTLLQDIDRIEVISGPGGTLWGANAVNGVINIITRSAAATDGAFVELGAGDDDRLAGVRYGAKLGDGMAIRGYAKFLREDSLTNAAGADGVDGSRRSQAGFRLDRERSAGRLTVQGDFYDGDEAGVFQDDFTLGTLPAGSHRGTTNIDGANVLARWERTLDSGGNLSFQAYYDRTQRDIPSTYAEKRDTFDIDFQHRVPLGARNDVLWGAGFRTTSDELANTLFSTFEPARRTDRTSSAFVQDKLEVKRKRMFLTLGSKFEHNDYSGFESQPNARFSWLMSDRRSFWAAVSRAVRIPARLDADLKLTLPLAGPPTVPIPVYVTADGSDDFDTEKLIAYEAGYRFQPNARLSFDISTFLNDYDDLQTVEPQEAVFVLVPPSPYAILPQVLDNLLEGRATGGTFVANWQPAARWRLRFQYARLDLHLERKPGSRDTSRVVEAGNSPKNQAAVYSFIDLPHRLQLYAGVRYVGELPNLGVDAYMAADASLSWRSRGHLSASLTLENLNDARHLEFGDSNQVERSAVLRVTWIP